MKYSKLVFIIMAGLLTSASANAHHARFGFFDSEKTIEISGVVTDLSWANPHVRVEMSVTNSTGEQEQWHAEMAALSSFRNRGITDAFIAVGEKVSLFGSPSRKGETEMSPTNLLREDGTEVILDFRASSYFASRSTSQYVDPIASEESKQAARDAADGIFRVWSTESSARFRSYYGDFPLTEAAQNAKSQWDSSSADLLSCWQKGMPLLMVTPHPIEFSQRGDDIVMRYEEDDAERIIHMGEADENARPSELGYSIGTWEGGMLVVETSKINAAIFDDVGTPQSDSVSLVERFTLSEDEQRLDYLLNVTDPATFTESIELTHSWVWRPERQVEKWNCQDKI